MKAFPFWKNVNKRILLYSTLALVAIAAVGRFAVSAQTTTTTIEEARTIYTRKTGIDNPKAAALLLLSGSILYCRQ